MTTEWTRREMMKATLGAAAAGAVVAQAGRVSAAAEGSIAPQVAAKAEGAPWFRRCLVGIEYGPTGANTTDPTVFMSKASGKEIVENALKARAEYLVVFMKDMRFAYYNSSAARKCPALGGTASGSHGERDLLREFLDEGKNHQLPIIAYCQVQYDDSSWEAHPDWRMKDPKQADVPGRLCYRSGYLDFIKTICGEMMAYEIAGFHIDMLDFGFSAPYGCWCENCRKAFREAYGVEMPAGVTWDDAWDKMLQFRCDSNTRFCTELQSFIKAKRPEISVDFNYHGSPPFSWPVGQRPVQHALNGDLVTAEGLPFCFGHYSPSLLALFMTAARPEGPVQCVTSRSVYDYHDFTVRPAAEMKWEVLTYLAHGAQCTIVDKAYYDGAVDALAYERMGAAFGEGRRKAELFGHKPLQEVGLYYSCRTRDWYGRDDAIKYMRAVWGAHKALVQSHIPCGMVMDENVSIERLRTFPVVYMANTAILSPAEVALLEQYVTEGGRLFVTGLSGLYDTYGKLQPDSSLARLIGAKLVRTYDEHADNYVRFPKTLSGGDAGFILDQVPVDWPILTWGPIAVLEPTTAKAFGELMTAHRAQGTHLNWRLSPDKTVGPALLINDFGKGKVVTMPCAVDEALSSDYRMPEHRNLIHNAIRCLNPAPEVLVDAPRNVEIVVTQDEANNRLLVHLLCFNAPPTSAAAILGEGRKVLPPIMEEEMPYTARIRVKRPFTVAYPFGQGAEAVAKASSIDLEVSSSHETLIIQS